MNLTPVYKSLLLSATGLVLLYQPLHLWMLAFIVFIPVVHAIENPGSLLKLSGRLFLVFYCWHLGTISSALFISMALKDKLMLLLFFNGWYSLMMLLPVIAYYITARNLKSPFRMLLLPLYWCAYEFMLNSSEFGMPLLSFNNAFNSSVFLSAAQRFFGPYLYVFMIWVFNYLAWHFINDSNKLLKKKYAVAAISVLAAFLLLNTLAYFTVPTDSSKPVNVAVVQPNFTQQASLSAGEARKRVRLLGEMSSGVSHETDLIIWHESAVQGYMINKDSLETDPVIRYIRNLAVKLNKPILTGTILYKIYGQHDKGSSTARAADPASGNYYDVFNSALLVTPDSLPVQQYYKAKLVPFIERMPYIEFFPVSESMKISIGSVYPSFAHTDETVPLAYKDLRIAPLICSEGAFVDYAGKFCKQGANLFVVIANEGWTGKELTSTMFSNMLLPASACFNRSLIKCSNNGESFVSGFSGEILQRTSFNEQALLQQNVCLNAEPTPYQKYGSMIYFLLAGAVVVFLVYKEVQVRKAGNNFTANKTGTGFILHHANVYAFAVKKRASNHPTATAY